MLLFNSTVKKKYNMKINYLYKLYIILMPLIMTYDIEGAFNLSCIRPKKSVLRQCLRLGKDFSFSLNTVLYYDQYNKQN